MNTIKETIQRVYLNVRKNYWSDPVWSKVISAGIITVLGSILTTIYLLIKAFIDKISFEEAFSQLTTFFKQDTSVNNFILVIFILIFSLFLIKFILQLVLELKRQKKIKLEEQNKKEELPLVPLASTVFFSYRLASAFPGQRGLIWFDDPKIIVERLLILFKVPIRFKSDERDGFSSTPIWWFRDTSSMYIEKIKKLSKTKILMNFDELEIKRMAVNIDKAYYKCFIYLEVKAEKQTGLYKIDEKDIERHIETFGYSWEEYGLFKNKPIKRAEYDDGAATINSKVVDTTGAELRTRYLTDYNFLIAAHNSPFNSRKFERISEHYFNGILKNKLTPEELFEILFTFNKNEN
jgi:hypothetical protein